MRLKGISWKQMYRTSYDRFHLKSEPKSLAGRLFSIIRNKQEFRVLLTGLPNAGKVQAISFRVLNKDHHAVSTQVH
jgi:stage V sporulation protein SpoVS